MSEIARDRVCQMQNPQHLGELIRESMDDVGWKVTETAGALCAGYGRLSAARASVTFRAVPGMISAEPPFGRRADSVGRTPPTGNNSRTGGMWGADALCAVYGASVRSTSRYLRACGRGRESASSAELGEDA